MLPSAADALEPVQRLLVVGRRVAAEAERDHRVELETLRAMHRHDLDAVPARRIALRLLRLERVLEPRGVVEIAEPFLRASSAKNCSAVRSSSGRSRQAGPSSARHVRSTQRANELSARAANAASRRARVASSRARPSSLNACDALGVAHQIPDGAPRRVVTERVQVRPSEAAPRRAEHGEPSDTVVAMRERAREPEQVLRDGLLAERVDLDRVHRQAAARGAARAVPRGALRLCTSTAIDCSGSRASSAAMISATRALSSRGSAASEPAQATSCVGRGRARRDARTKRGRAGCDLVDAREHVRERLVDPRDDRRRGAKVTRERERLERNVADAALLRLEE